MTRISTKGLGVKAVLSALMLTAAWCGLWGTVSFANVASGLVLAILIIGAGLGTAEVGGLRIKPLAHFGWVVFVDLISSTLSVAGEILTPTDYTSEAIVAVRLDPEAKPHMMLLSIAINLTPGTAVVEVDRDATTLYVHLLHVKRRAETEAHIELLARLATDALPLPTPGTVQ